MINCHVQGHLLDHTTMSVIYIIIMSVIYIIPGSDVTINAYLRCKLVTEGSTPSPPNTLITSRSSVTNFI